MDYFAGLFMVRFLGERVVVFLTCDFPVALFRDRVVVFLLATLAFGDRLAVAFVARAVDALPVVRLAVFGEVFFVVAMSDGSSIKGVQLTYCNHAPLAPSQGESSGRTWRQANRTSVRGTCTVLLTTVLLTNPQTIPSRGALFSTSHRTAKVGRFQSPGIAAVTGYLGDPPTARALKQLSAVCVKANSYLAFSGSRVRGHCVVCRDE